MVKYYFDTYALIEIVRNSPNYLKFLEESIVTTKFNLAELIYITMSEFGQETAKSMFERFKNFETEVSDEILFKAMKFRFENKKKGLSYADCIGYVFALENKLKFLTGDGAFEGMVNVEFMK